MTKCATVSVSIRRLWGNLWVDIQQSLGTYQMALPVLEMQAWKDCVISPLPFPSSHLLKTEWADDDAFLLSESRHRLWLMQQLFLSSTLITFLPGLSVKLVIEICEAHATQKLPTPATLQQLQRLVQIISLNCMQQTIHREYLAYTCESFTSQQTSLTLLHSSMTQTHTGRKATEVRRKNNEQWDIHATSDTNPRRIGPIGMQWQAKYGRNDAWDRFSCSKTKVSRNYDSALLRRYSTY